MERLKSFPCMLLVFIIFLCSEGKKTFSGLQTTETKLYNQLLSSYNKKVRPVIDAEDAVLVNVSLTLANVIDIDEKHQSLTTLLWIRSEWFDPFLSWNEAEFPGIRYFILQADEIWTPDLMANNLLGNTKPLVEEFLGRREGVEVFPTGRAQHWFPVLLNSFCPMDMALFPFDVQSCPIVIGK